MMTAAWSYFLDKKNTEVSRVKYICHCGL